MESCCWTSCLTVLVVFFVIYKLVDYLLRLPRIDRYSERYILVTGCDSGFGQALARRLDGLGCHVFAGCLTEAGQVELSGSCSDRLQTLDIDVTNHDSVLRALESVKSRLPPGKGLWAVVNNAGVAGGAGLEDWLTIDDYKSAMAVNLLGLIDVATTFLPLIKKTRGRVVNMGSIGGRLPMPRATPYHVSKFGVEPFSDNLRRSLRLFGCKVCLIEPGLVRTNLTSLENAKAAMEKTWNRLSPEVQEEYGEEYFHACYNVTSKFINAVAATKLDGVVDAYEHAILGRFPRARYTVGLDTHLLWLPITYLPEWIADPLMCLSDYSLPLPAALKKKKVE